MTNSAWLPVGADCKNTLITKGDILKLVTGETVTFTEMKRTKFHAKYNGRGLVVPIYRDRSGKVPFITEVMPGKDTTVLVKAVNPTKLKIGELFFVENCKETFMFAGNKIKAGREVVVGVDIATGKNWSIAKDMTIGKIDLTSIKASLPSMPTSF